MSPNWCECELEIEGPDIKEILAYIQDTKDNDEVIVFSCDKVIPYPKEFKDLDRRREEFDAKLTQVRSDEERDKVKAEYGLKPDDWYLKDGFNSGGYEWCNANWGTKWGCCDSVIETQSDDYVVIKWESAWKAPEPVIVKLGELFPKNRFTLQYWEGGCAFQGELIMQNGEIELDATYPYHGHRGG
jgi:hypothetical protein